MGAPARRPRGAALPPADHDPRTPAAVRPEGPLPPELADLGPQARARYRRARRLAHLLDNAFPLPLTDRRVGVDALLSLVPGIGAVAGLALSAVVIAQGIAIGARGATVVRMLLNVAIDGVISSIPLMGWVADVVFKANARNVALLSTHALDPERTRQESRRAILVTVLALAGLAVLVTALAVALVIWLVRLLF